jgi:hypothetical protein
MIGHYGLAAQRDQSVQVGKDGFGISRVLVA